MNLAKLLAAAGNGQQAYPIYMAQRPGRGIYSASQRTGYKAAMSRNGNVLAVASNYNSGLSNAYVFIYTRTGQTWVQNTQIAVDPTNSSGGSLALAISADGLTIAVGLKGLSIGATQEGGVSVYVRTGSTYALQQQFQSSAPAAYTLFGNSLAMSDDGNTIVSTQGNAYPTSLYVQFFGRTGSTWALTQSLNLPAGSLTSLSMSADGAKCVVGNYQESTGGGGVLEAFYYLTKTSGTWSIVQRVARSMIEAQLAFATNVELSGDGQTLAIGCNDPSADGVTARTGRVYVYKLVSGLWASPVEIPYPLAKTATWTTYFGAGLAFSTAGDTLAISANQGNSQKGAAWVWSNTGAGWVLQSSLYTYQTPTSMAPGYSGQCEAICMSGDGSWVCVPDNNAVAGSGAYSGAGDVWFIPR
jgi:hypothetical protein